MEENASLDALELLLRAFPFDERLALESRWELTGATLEERLAEAGRLAHALGDSCEWE